ncbi:M4 family metallopeptidase [Kitasatospora atroaurantiaca]|uniref:Neutral metalloproteinase n=1 Tax=Kitasatospora atroaurantiaca TaxID=285545 RepID=A0A561EJ63_9ACTN|nr:M4 family metallopeptidase [Kitasatospora atroaurantiaca]TWE15633.1 Zn-dependent metalloprotease [Kitasatospora atroaurantiaca]
MSSHARTRVPKAAIAASAALLLAGIPALAQATATAPTAAASPQFASRAQLFTDARVQSLALAKSLGLSDQEKLVVKDAFRDADGTRHLRYERMYHDLPVLGGDLIVHQAPNGSTRGVDRAAKASLNGLAITPAQAAPKAQATALAAEAGSTVQTAPRLVVWAAKGTPILAWETVVTSRQKDGTPSKLHVVTDAKSGAVLQKFEGIETGSGKGVFVGSVDLTTTQSGSQYQLQDASRGGQSANDMGNGTSGNGTLFANATDQWGDGTAANRESAAVDAYFGAAKTWDFYKNTFSRNGIRNDGVGALSRVHYDTGYVNAFWDDSCFCMTYGDGQNDSAPLTEIDVAGHEMTHGVTSATAGLNYSGESGGLNEATSDIMGTMVEWYANLPANPPNYWIGELINLNGNNTPLRYMDQPSKDGSSADSWYDGVGNLDVHYSSGVANHFFYLLSEGSGSKSINGFDYNSPTVNSTSVTGIGRDKAAQVWYRALTTYFTSTTDYAGARDATLKAATDLYGADSTESKQVATAWAAVNVGSLPG